MNEYKICNINESTETMEQAAKLLLEAFLEDRMWPDLDEKMAMETVSECLIGENICIGIKTNIQLIGWIGLRPMYEKT